ncbi:MAG: hypothetical protein ABIW82_01105 [Dokdonella sp.]
MPTTVDQPLMRSRHRIDVAGLSIVDTLHRGASELDCHEHEEAYICVVLEGS